MKIDKILTDEKFLPTARETVAAAHRKIYIATFKAELTTKPRGRRVLKLFETVFEKARLGLDVRVLISKCENYGHIPAANVYAVREMKAKGVLVRHLRNNRLCHAKLIIIDNTVAILGSHNLSIKSCHNNFEISYMCYDVNLIKELTQVYETLWEAAKKG